MDPSTIQVRNGACHVFEMVVGETTYCVGEDLGDERFDDDDVGDDVGGDDGDDDDDDRGDEVDDDDDDNDDAVWGLTEFEIIFLNYY